MISAPTTPTTPKPYADLSDKEFYSVIGEINTEYQNLLDLHRKSQENMTAMLTEQLTRHIIKKFPTTTLVFIRVAAEFHTNHSTTCSGHNHRLVPFEVCDEQGNNLGYFNDMSPVIYLLERLTPFLGLTNRVLDVHNREWLLDCE